MRLRLCRVVSTGFLHIKSKWLRKSRSVLPTTEQRLLHQCMFGIGTTERQTLRLICWNYLWQGQCLCLCLEQSDLIQSASKESTARHQHLFILKGKQPSYFRLPLKGNQISFHGSTGDDRRAKLSLAESHHVLGKDEERSVWSTVQGQGPNKTGECSAAVLTPPHLHKPQQYNYHAHFHKEEVANLCSLEQ